MRLKICLALVLVATLVASACAGGPSPEELVAPTVESFTIHLMEREDAPGVMDITNFEIVINNPNPYEGEIIFKDFDFHGGGGAVGTVRPTNWCECQPKMSPPVLLLSREHVRPTVERFCQSHFVVASGSA